MSKFSVLLMLSCTVVLTACGSDDTQPIPTFTQVDEILADSQHPCKDSLITVAHKLIKEKDHFLQKEIIQKETSEQQTNATEKKNIDIPKKNDDPLMISGVLVYKDRPSHIRFDSSLQGNNCMVVYQLDYHFDTSCIEIREGAFKKWLNIGQLGKDTRHYVYKYNPNKTAYLTSIDRNLQCLVSVKQIAHIPLVQ